MENKEKINSISSYLKEIFGIKTVKLSIDGGFTCPNRDGKAGFGGCSFCSASGYVARVVLDPYDPEMLQRQLADRDVVGRVADVEDLPVGTPALVGRQIGRASCRERV